MLVAHEIHPRRSRCSWSWPQPRLVEQLLLWIPLADPSAWVTKALKVRICGLRVAVRCRTEIQAGGVRLHLLPPRGGSLFAVDALSLRGQAWPEGLQPALELVEPASFQQLREHLAGPGAGLRLCVDNFQGYGDIVHSLVSQWLFLQLLALPLPQDPVALLCSRGSEILEEKSIDIVNDFVQVGYAFIAGSVAVYPLRATDVYDETTSVMHRLGRMLDDFCLRCLQQASPEQPMLISGGVRLLDLLLDGLAAGLATPARWPRLAQRLAGRIQEDAVPLLFAQVDPACLPDQQPPNRLVCQQRLGDLAVVTIAGLDLVPWFVDRYADRYFEVLAAESSQLRRPASSLAKLAALAASLHPHLVPQLISDGYSLAERMLLLPKNLLWVSDQLGLTELETAGLIGQEIQRLQQQLEQDAALHFPAGAVIGATADHDRLSLQALQTCDACISTSGHFCFTILNYLCQRQQVLHTQPIGRRFDLLRNGLTLFPLSPADIF